MYKGFEFIVSFLNNICRTVNEICRRHGLYVIEDREPHHSDWYYISKKEQAGIPTMKSILRETIDGIIPHCRNMEDFAYQLRMRGYRYGLDPRGRYWRAIPPGSAQSIRLYRLGEAYTHDRIRERIGESFRAGNYTPAQEHGYRRQYRLRTREHKLYEKTSLYRKYLYYCYKLGYLPRQQNRKPTKAHPLLQEDLIWLDKISLEVRLLGEHHIDTAEQLASFSEDRAGKLKQLDAERAELWKEVGRKIPEDQKAEKKERIYAISAEMKKIRKEISLCRDISERSEAVSPKLEKIFEEECRMNGRLQVRDPR